MQTPRIATVATAEGEALITLRVPLRSAKRLEAHLASLLQLMGLDDAAAEAAAGASPGVRLKTLRQAAGMTQKGLADALGTLQARISEYEMGTRPVPLETARRLASIFHVKPSEFLDLEAML